MNKILHLLFILLLIFQGAAKAQDRIYWGIPSKNISSAQFDGSDVKVSVALSGQTFDMETDFYKKVLYWGDYRSVKKANTDGTNLQTLYTGTGTIGGLALDLINNKLYFSEYGGNTVIMKRCNLDGTGLETIYTASGYINTYTLSISTTLQKLYWTEQFSITTNRVMRCNLDGTNVETLMTISNFMPGLTIDEKNQRLYLAYWQDNKVMITDMTCSTTPTLVFDSSNGTFQMAVSNVENKLYFGEMATKKIRSCNLDGSSPQDIVSGLSGQPMALSIPTIPPAPTINANETYTFELNDFLFSSVDKDLLTKIKITTLTNKGTIYLDANNNNIVDAGEAVGLNQEIPKADLVAGTLKFNPVTNDYGSPYTTFTFKWFDGSSYSTLDYLQYIYVLSVAPTVTTQAVSGIGSTTATGNGNITNLGVPFPTSYGICWNTAGSPTTSGPKVDLGAKSATGDFTTAITGLTANTTYEARAYAINEAGTSYGTEVTFTTSSNAAIVSSVSVPASATYITGQNLDFTVNFNEAITVDPGGGTPYIPVTLNTGGNVNASYLSGSGTSAFVFRYTVATGNLDADGVTLGNAITANGGTLKNAGGTDANLTLTSVGSTANVKVDAVAPTILSVSSATDNGIYKLGDVISVTVTFDEAVTVTGTPTLSLNSGGTASYYLGSGTATLTFGYTVGSEQSSADLDYSATNSLALAGGIIKDAAGNDATLTLPTVGAASSLGGQKDILIAINPSSGGTIAADQAGCYPFSPNEITSSVLPSGHVGTLEYKWQSSTTSSSTGFSDIAASNAATYDPGSLIVDTWYKRLARVNCMSDWTDAAESNVVKMTVYDLPLKPTAGSSSYIFDGTEKTAVANVGIGETVDWYAAATGVTTASLPTGYNVGTYSAYAEARNTTTGCVSASRTLIMLEITKATLTVTAEAKSKVYGDVNPTLTFQYSGWKNSDNESVLDTKPTASTTVNQLSNVGTYTSAITVSGGSDNNYAFSYVPATFAVTTATLTVTAEAKTRVYGDANPALTFAYSGWKNGDDADDLTTKPTATTTVNELSNVGTYANAITVSGGSENNYAFSYVPADLTVTAATLTVTTDAKSKVYGDENPTLTFQCSGWKNDETETVLDTKPTVSTLVDQLSNVGTYTNSITVSGGADNNYVFSYVPADFVVTAATLTVTADAKSKVYGDVNPTLTFQCSGWKNDETVTVLDTKPTVSTLVNQLSNVGTYTNSTTVSGGADNNYAFSYVPANLTVTKAMLLVAADDQTKPYGQINPTLTFHYSGWKNGDDESDLDTQPTVSTTVTNTTSIGTYTHVIDVSGGADKNYDFTYIPADFEVTKGVLIVWLDPKTKAYGQDNPVLTYRYTGFMNGDDESDLDILHTPFSTITKYTEPGVYLSSITMVGGLDDHYQIFNVPANFTVTKARPQIVFDELAIKTYGDQDFTIAVSSTIPGIPVTLTSSNENVVVVSGNMVTIKGIGTTNITASLAGNDRFEAVSKSNVLSVNPKMLTVNGLLVYGKEYDGTAVAELAGGTLSGVVYSDVIALNIPATGTFSQTIVGNNIPVSATVTVSGDKAGNYTFQTPEMKGNILPKVINVNAKEVTVECIQSETELNYTYEPSLIGEDKFTGTLTRTVGDTPGVYSISAGTLIAGSNYSISFKSANFTILDQANRPPVVNVVADQKTPKNSKQLVVILTGIDPVSNCITQDIESIVASAENKTLVPEILVEYLKEQTTATLKIKIADNQAGETKITVKLKDNGGTENGGIDTKEISFNLNVEIPTGVADIPAKFDVRIYPNPSSGPVTIDCIGFSDPSIRIFNIAGEGMLKKSNLGGTSQSTNLSDFAPGVYFVEISEDGKVITKKLIIKK